MTKSQRLQDYADRLKREAEAKRLEVFTKFGDGSNCKPNGKKYNQILDAQSEVWKLEHKAMLAQFDADACFRGDEK